MGGARAALYPSTQPRRGLADSGGMDNEPVFTEPPDHLNELSWRVIGAAIAVPLLGEPVTWPLIAAAVLMAVGVYLHLAERHEHEHVHEPLFHEHRHVHDMHHQHARAVRSG